MFVLFTPLMLLCLLGQGRAYASIYVHSHGGVNPKETKDFPVYTSNKEVSNKSEKQCSQYSSGTWVHDNSYPLYNAVECSYITTQVKCRPNGRPDSDYEKWRWQPSGCAIPRFNASHMLEMLRGKRLMFVGDSISRSQFESMACLLQAVIPSNKKSSVDESSSYPLAIFKALDYNASVELFWAPFLVDLETTKQNKKILHLDSIQNNGLYWKGADILIFESSHWWPDQPGSEQRWDVAMEGNKTYTKIDPMVAYRKALTTWANWVSSNIDFQRTRLVFRSMSLRHYRCEKEKEPVQNASTYNPRLPPQVSVLNDFLNTLQFRPLFMDITRMTALRIDAHPSLYDKPAPGDPGGRDPGEQDVNGDCSHWCLPGVPDEWNKLLYDFLI